MTKVKIEPGICKFSTLVTATASEDEETEVTIKVASGCPSVKKMMEELGSIFDAYEVCLDKTRIRTLLRVCQQKLSGTLGMPDHCGNHQMH